MRLLVTRPEPDASRTAETLRGLGHDVLVAPLMRTEFVAAEFGGPFAAVLLTSANAARALAAHQRKADLLALPAFTVGARTAAAARDAGFVQVESADGALGDLVALIAPRFAGRRLIYLAGEDRAGDLGGELGAHDIAVETVVVYRAVAADTLPTELVEALRAGALDVVLHYSRRSAVTLLRLAEAEGVLKVLLSLAHYGLSGDVVAPLRQAGAATISVAKLPTESELIALIR